MQVIVTFKKTNPDELVQSFELYRSNNKDDLYSAENKISEQAPIAGETVEFVDDSVVYGVLYYYGMMTKTVDGFGIPSVAKPIKGVVNKGAITGEIIRGDVALGFVSSHTSEHFSMIERSRNIIRSAVLASGSAAGVPYTGSNTSADKLGSVVAYYDGEPGIYIPVGGFYISGSTSATPLNGVIPLAKSIVENLNAGDAAVFGGVEYIARIPTEKEWMSLFLRTATAIIDSITVPYKQSVVQPLFTNYFCYTATTERALLIDENGDGALFQLGYGTADGSYSKVTTGGIGTVFIPIVYNPKQY